MKALTDLANTNAPDVDFPYGDLRDNPGDGTGTPVNRNMLSDPLQFFQKLADEAGITPNGLVDNEYNGWQSWEALRTIYPNNQKTIQSTWNMDTDSTLNVTHGIADFTKIRSISVMVVNNAGTIIIPLVGPEGSISFTDSTTTTLARENAGGFDSDGFNAATIYTTYTYID